MITLDEFSFHHTLAGTAGTALVIFTSVGCSSCRAWKKLLAEYQSRHPVLAVFEVDAGHAQALAREFNVFHLPALHLYHNGHYHSPLACEARLERLEPAIRQALAAPPHEAP